MIEQKGLRYDTNKPDVLKFLYEVFTTTEIGKEFITSLTRMVENEEVKCTPHGYDSILINKETVLVPLNDLAPIFSENSYYEQIQSGVNGVIRQMAYGGIKYPRGNWKLGMDYSKIINPLLRHLIKYVFLGHNRDKESGAPEWNGVMCNALFLGTYQAEELGEDNLQQYRLEVNDE